MFNEQLPLDVRFWSHVDKSGECWLWTASLTKNGYGKFGVEGKTLYAHRVAWELQHGPIPPGVQILHGCEKDYALGDWTPRRCMRHLRAGSNAENVQDAQATGHKRIGETAPRAVLTLAQVQDILSRDISRRGAKAALAREFRVSASTIHLILIGERWAASMAKVQVKDGIVVKVIG